MTLVLGALTDNFALVMADNLAKLGSDTTLTLGGNIKVDLSKGTKLHGVQKIYLDAGGEGLVGVAGNAVEHQPYLTNGSTKVAFERDDEIAAVLSTLTNYSSIPSLPNDHQYRANQCVHVFRYLDRFYVTNIDVCTNAFSRQTRRNSPSATRVFGIGSGAPCFGELIENCKEWKHFEAAPSTVTHDELVTLFSDAFKIASADSALNVGSECRTWLLEKTGVWHQI